MVAWIIASLSPSLPIHFYLVGLLQLHVHELKFCLVVLLLAFELCARVFCFLLATSQLLAQKVLLPLRMTAGSGKLFLKVFASRMHVLCTGMPLCSRCVRRRHTLLQLVAEDGHAACA